MDIQHSQVTKVTITGADGLDPIHLFLEDLHPGAGRVVLSCYDQAWTSYWGGMGSQTIAEFLGTREVPYLAGRLVGGAQTQEADIPRLVAELRADIRKGRRSGRYDGEEAREHWEAVEALENLEDSPDASSALWAHHTLLSELRGEEWWRNVPERGTKDYRYLCRILQAVQAALAMQKEPA